ncbi:hypothetical protein CI109_102167 [Kwoniella shandongensis]|uniref:Amidohydrolase-related domain-containing protein n=1 Tax=Kwoniella shandongensis TaxID=1734106 RepID=A0AAJ8MWJ6_9TREE
MTISNITSSLGNFEILSPEEQDQARKKTTGGVGWVPPHWISHPVPADYDISTPPWIRPEAGAMSLVGVNVVDVESSKIHPSQTVKIKAGKIVSIEKSQFAHMQEDGWESINAGGLYLSPGLIDVHTHITAVPATNPSAIFSTNLADTALKTTYVLKGMLYRGFTTVRDVGGATRHYKEATEQWLIPGPRIFQGGPVLSQSGGHGDDSDRDDISLRNGPHRGAEGYVADGVDECLRAARKLMMAGADHIKICSSGGVASLTDKLDSEQFTVPEIKAICDTVRMMVTAHCFTSQGARNAIEGGIGGIEHGHLIDDDEVLKLMAKKGVHLTPTLIVQELLARPPYNAIIPPSSREKLKLVIDGGYKVIKRAHELGVNIAYGTDCFASMQPCQLSEFDLRATVLPSDVILKQATINGAKVLGMEGKIGIIKEGAAADLLILSSNPLEDVTILNKPLQYLKGVIKDGRVVKSTVDGLRVEVPLV